MIFNEILNYFQYLEASVVEKSCVQSLTLVENRIRASSRFFKAACKAGPWVADNLLDEKLSKLLIFYLS